MLRVLDTPAAGAWLLAPVAGGECTARRYHADTLVLETDWATREGFVRVTDFMPHRGAAPDVVRIVAGISGSVAMRSDMRLRFDYGRMVRWVRGDDGGITAIAGPDAAYLRTPAETHDDEGSSTRSASIAPTATPVAHRRLLRVLDPHALDAGDRGQRLTAFAGGGAAVRRCRDGWCVRLLEGRTPSEDFRLFEACRCRVSPPRGRVSVWLPVLGDPLAIDRRARRVNRRGRSVTRGRMPATARVSGVLGSV